MRRLPAVELPYSALAPREAALRTASRRSRPKHDLRLDGRSKASSRRSIPLAALSALRLPRRQAAEGKRLVTGSLPPLRITYVRTSPPMVRSGSGAPVAATTLNERPLFESASSSVYGGDGREAEARAARRQAHVWVAAIIIVGTNRHREGHPGRTYWSVQLEARGCNC